MEAQTRERALERSVVPSPDASDSCDDEDSDRVGKDDADGTKGSPQQRYGDNQ